MLNSYIFTDEKPITCFHVLGKWIIQSAEKLTDGKIIIHSTHIDSFRGIWRLEILYYDMS